MIIQLWLFLRFRATGDAQQRKYTMSGDESFSYAIYLIVHVSGYADVYVLCALIWIVAFMCVKQH